MKRTATIKITWDTDTKGMGENWLSPQFIQDMLYGNACLLISKDHHATVEYSTKQACEAFPLLSSLFKKD